MAAHQVFELPLGELIFFRRLGEGEDIAHRLKQSDRPGRSRRGCRVEKHQLILGIKQPLNQSFALSLIPAGRERVL
jgi:hypothetical protein